MLHSFSKAAGALAAAAIVVAGCAADGRLVHVTEPDAVRPGAVPTALITARGGAENLRGDVVIMRAPNSHDIIVVLDGGAGEKTDGVANQAFRLQRENAADALTQLPSGPIHLRDAALHYTARSLRVRHPRFSAVLYVRDAATGVTGGPGEAPGSHVWGGFGLARANGRWSMSQPRLAQAAENGFRCGGDDRARLSALSSDPDLEPVCDVGGPGYTSCSVEGASVTRTCSVSCGEGFYSCCNVYAGCACIQRPPSGT